jgi:hypothetical protein
MNIGIAMPEAGVIALPETANGDVAGVAGLEAAVSACDVVIAGPAMGGMPGSAALSINSSTFMIPGDQSSWTPER